MLLGPGDPLGFRPQRVIVNGLSGSGKTTLSRRLGELLDLPHTEIDALFHGPAWQPREEFLADVEQLVAGERWVTEYQYTPARPLLLQRCDLVVWLDPPVWVSMWQVVRRTVDRRVRRLELWNGNREGPLWRIVTDDEHIIRWAWRTRRQPGERVEAILRERPGLPVVHLRSRHEVRRWLSGLGGRPARPR